MAPRKNALNNKPPTMHDVAKLAGVSQPTVSRVLNQTETTIPVSEETREKVFAAIKELGYRPNMTARSLRTQRTQMISLMIADISNGFYHPIARTVQDVARTHDYDVLIANSDHLYENEKHFCEAVMRRPVDGVIMVPEHLTYEDIDNLIAITNTPIAVLGQHVDHPSVDAVYADDEKGTYEAVKWLITERGYASIGYLGVPSAFPPGIRRWRGFQKALTELGITFDPDFLMEGDFTVDSGRSAVQSLIAKKKLPGVIFALNDLMAIGAISALQDADLSVPGDVGVMGFDNIREATIITPKLTTVAQYPSDIGQKLAEVLFERIDGLSPDYGRRIEVPLTLMPRESA
ncbi:MAG TPA: LacI family DNA-binding transcriptional regulator [Aggregatilineaceae bacterium]|nr:LacI family DNA-binding transcriptional regulator [Aggregatilineaceae bacterium]